jgi:hypothetical protein
MRIWMIVMLAACGSKPRDAAPSGGGAVAPMVAPAAAATGVDVPAANAGMGAPAADATGAGPAAEGARAPTAAAEVPTRPAALQAWLVEGHYASWTHESKPHESAGPHGDAVRTFVSPSLLASLQRGGAPHPRGASAVKELYDARGTHTGWAVSVKVDDASANGRGWYWYEVFSTKAGARPAYEGKGERLCRECHADGGSDQVLIPYPLQ